MDEVSQGAEARVAADIRLWPGAAPGSEGATNKESTFVDPASGGMCIRNVAVPTLTPMLPESGRANGTTMIVAPGGGFYMLSWESEGTQVADWLCTKGVSCFVLKYRLDDTGTSQGDLEAYVIDLLGRFGSKPTEEAIWTPAAPLAAADGARAVELIRERADEWGLRKDRIGLMGFSAGAFVASQVAETARGLARPDYVAAIYGGAARTEIPADAPPLFCLAAADDPLCYDCCMALFQAWRGRDRPAELHIYANGGHGFGMTSRGLSTDNWIERLGDWMATQELI